MKALSVGLFGFTAAALFALAPAGAGAAEPLTSDTILGDPSSSAIFEPTNLADVRLAGSKSLSEHAGSVAVNPKNPRRLVAAIGGSRAGACVTRSSDDGGRTWAPAAALPLPADLIGCDSPAVTYSPDGRRMYAAYSAYRNEPPFVLLRSDMFLSRSTDEGVTWDAPSIALASASGGTHEVNTVLQLATPRGEADADHLYLLARALDNNGHYDQLVFIRSSNRGRTWSLPMILARGDYWYGGYAGGTVAAGPDGDVLVAWGYGAYDPVNDVTFNQIRLTNSTNFGETFAPPIVAADGDDVDLSSPDMKIGVAHVAHIVYRRGYGVDADIEYIHSYNRRPFYTAWAPPVTLNDDDPGHVQGEPSLALEPCGAASNILHAAWTDGRRKVGRQDIYYARKVASPGYPWSSNIRISDASSPAEFFQAKGLAAGAGRAFAVWTDARHNPSSFSKDRSNVYGSRIISGVNCALGLPPQ